MKRYFRFITLFILVALGVICMRLHAIILALGDLFQQ